MYSTYLKPLHIVKFGPDQAGQNVGPDLFDFLMVFLKDIFENVYIELVYSVDNLCKQLEPRLGLIKFWA